MRIFRTHDIGAPYTASYRKVRNRYISEIKRGVLPTQSEMDEWIKRKMDERPHNATFSIDVDPEMAGLWLYRTLWKHTMKRCQKERQCSVLEPVLVKEYDV